MRIHPTTLLGCLLCLIAGAAAADPPGPHLDAALATAKINEPQVRKQLSAQLLQKWEPVIRESGVASLDEWRSEMTGIFERADLELLKLAATRNIYAAMVKTAKGNPTDDETAASDIAQRADELGLTTSQMKVLGDADKDLLYVPVAPCRIADTRVAGGAIVANTVRNFDVTAVSNYSFQGGDSSDCGGAGAAGSFAAAAFRITAITPTASGYLTVFPFGATQPLVSALNYQAGDIIAATTITRLDQGASANELSIYSFAQTHVVIDIVGYYRNPGAPTLECVSSGETIDTVAAGSTRNTVAPSCPASYTQTATNCESSTWQMPFVYFADGTCSAQNNSSGSAQLRASRTCCRPKFN